MRTASHSLGRWFGLGDDGLPPGPPARFLLAAIHLLRDPLHQLSRAREQYGDAACFRVGPIRFVSVADPDYAQHVLVRNHRNYVKSRNYEGLRLVMGNGLVTSEGEHWKRQRKLAQPAFHRQRLATLADTMSTCVGERLAQWDQRTRSGVAPHVDVHEEMMELTLRIVGRTLFGTSLAAASEASPGGGAGLGTGLGALGPAVTTCLHKANDYAESLVRIPLWVPTLSNLRFARAKRLLDGIVQGIIEQRRRSPGSPSSGGPDGEREDLLGMLMAATDEGGGEGMSDQQLRDEVMTLFLAGHETIATAMSWTWMLLQQHPEVAARVREEATAVLGGRAARFEDLPRLVYTGQVIDEVLRLYPPAWIVERQAVDEDRLGPWRIPPGTIVAVSPWVLHRHPGLWKDPLRFDPDRFAVGPDRKAGGPAEGSTGLRGRPKHAYLPFGAGPRVCIGNNFALMEAKIILSTMIQRYAVEVLRPEAIELDPRVTLRPRGGMSGRLLRLEGPVPAHPA